MRAFYLHTYVFWALFSLVILSYLLWLPLPFLFPLALLKLWKLAAFLAVPVAFGLLAGVALLRVYDQTRRRLGHPADTSCLPVYVFNGAFLAAFLLGAEHYKDAAIAAQLAGHQPQCVQVNSFFNSVKHAGRDLQFQGHALFKEDGKTFYWSYSTMRFFEGHEALDRNFACHPNWQPSGSDALAD